MKKKPHPTPKPKEFSSSPFRTLKGVVIPAPTSPAQHPVPQMATRTDRDEDDLDLFLRAVSDVSPISPPSGTEPGEAAPAVSPGTLPSPAVPRARKFEEEDRTLFLKALEGMDVRFDDEIPDEANPLRPISASRLKQLRQGAIRINLELDLHGLTRDQALESLGHFITGAWRREVKAVLVITGKGNNSTGEPVLQSAVAGWLRDKGRKMVVEFSPAPRQMGGTGAFVVFLREHGDDARKGGT